MIENGSITYPGVNSTIRNYQPPNQVLCAFLVAILTTILTYQLAAILFDLFLGFKRPGQATASDISTLILTEDSSLLSIMASLNISRTITRWKFHGFGASDDSDCPANHHHHAHIPARVLFKFFVLLIAAPFASTLAVFITIERDFPLTFADVRFGGVAFGLNENFETPISAEFSEVCVTYDTVLSRLESPLTEFSACFLASQTIGQVPPNRTRSFRMSHGEQFESLVLQVPRDAILVEFEQSPSLWTVVMHADMKTSNRVYRVRQNVDLRLAEKLFGQAVAKFKQLCGQRSVEELDRDTVIQREVNGSTWMFRWDVECQYSDDIVREILDVDMAVFTLIDADEFDLFEIGSESRTLKGDDLEFVSRRRSFATFGVLSITVLVVVALRVIIRVFTNNDVHLGIELVLKDTLRINRCDSMLQNNTRVDYSAQVYEGLEGQGSSLTLSESSRSDAVDDQPSRK